MATSTSFDIVTIRNWNFDKMDGSGIPHNSSVDAGECTCKNLNTFAMINQDSNKNLDNNEDGILKEKCLNGTRDLGTLAVSILNVFQDLIMLETSYMAKVCLIGFENLIMMAFKTSQLKPLKMKELNDYEDHTTDMLKLLKAKMSKFLQDQLNSKWSKYDFDLLPG